ncbi:TPA: (2Fe-2S) ferredoxin domain-containing protein [Legionella pneumophila]|uniref:2Fe-2S ferredoxin n=1 Tax=Legionella pneumophila TaxID=446 RepID=A0A2S6EVE5_LEGPN|nr:(2Fe-2S) ferredoxin domain-containing protein [Legionella pneumophila]APF04425.1 2Fe-2S ferredoxin [Legionella pneumophila subsp. fraseri]APF07408.1 2Fe-2S ferredoxin [Legionella pneumophila subsp. fraseri]AUB69862.1 2Fe-2S ferredoxin [Legionella pneumophila]AUB72837.1 2Fe-2S ferredoxin [Legionella pneumophila]KXB25835.1 2Fe-2S ferredoxin [Legionella pneumophila]
MLSHYTKHVFICTNQKAPGKQCCANSGGEEYFDFMKSKLLEFDLHGPGKIRVSKSGCLGRCSSGPCIVIYPEGVWYTYSSFEDIEQIIKNHLIDGELVEPLLLDR